MSESWTTLTHSAESAARGGKVHEAKDFYKQAMADADSRRDLLQAYYTRCNFAALLRLLEEYAEAEQLLRVAVQMRHDFPQQLALDPVSPLPDLERILVKQNRLSDVEQLHRADTDRMFAVYGRDSHEFKMSLMNLAATYGNYLKDMDKCRTYFREVLDWSRTAEPITRKMIYMNYDKVLRTAGLAAEADLAQQELAAMQQSNQVSF
ncbi:MAG TPA: hypothetical protein V6C89_04135 [Drouetiella sp.]